jgi:hypothetical protein
MSDIYKEFGVDFLRTRYAGPTAAEMKMAQEITRLRAKLEYLAGVMAGIERAAAGDIYSQKVIHAMALDALKSLEAQP